MENRSVAVDGPAGAGKSTLARQAARQLGFVYVDTGALYRCVGLHALRKNVGSKDEAAVIGLLPEIELEITYDGEGSQRMVLCGEDVTDAIRTPEASKYSSDVSAMPAVRGFLLSMQREMALKYDVIMDGRDIGTVVLPEAGLKVFLTAKLEKRAYRRYLELLESGAGATLEEVRRDMESRDRNDSERAAAPLKVADGAVILDTSEMDLAESLGALCGIIAGRYGL